MAFDPNKYYAENLAFEAESRGLAPPKSAPEDDLPWEPTVKPATADPVTREHELLTSTPPQTLGEGWEQGKSMMSESLKSFQQALKQTRQQLNTTNPATFAPTILATAIASAWDAVIKPVGEFVYGVPIAAGYAAYSAASMKDRNDYAPAFEHMMQVISQEIPGSSELFSDPVRNTTAKSAQELVASAFHAGSLMAKGAAEHANSEGRPPWYSAGLNAYGELLVAAAPFFIGGGFSAFKRALTDYNSVRGNINDFQDQVARPSRRPVGRQIRDITGAEERFSLLKDRPGGPVKPAPRKPTDPAYQLDPALRGTDPVKQQKAALATKHELDPQQPIKPVKGHLPREQAQERPPAPGTHLESVFRKLAKEQDPALDAASIDKMWSEYRDGAVRSYYGSALIEWQKGSGPTRGQSAPLLPRHGGKGQSGQDYTQSWDSPLTMTPSEFRLTQKQWAAVHGKVRYAPGDPIGGGPLSEHTIRKRFVEYVKSKVPPGFGRGLNAREAYNAAVQKAFELREVETARLKTLEEERIWRQHEQLQRLERVSQERMLKAEQDQYVMEGGEFDPAVTVAGGNRAANLHRLAMEGVGARVPKGTWQQQLKVTFPEGYDQSRVRLDTLRAQKDLPTQSLGEFNRSRRTSTDDPMADVEMGVRKRPGAAPPPRPVRDAPVLGEDMVTSKNIKHQAEAVSDVMSDEILDLMGMPEADIRATINKLRDSPITGEGYFGKQRGAVDPFNVAEALFKTSKDVKEFAERLRRTLGPEHHPYTETYYAFAKRKQLERTPPAVEEVKKGKKGKKGGKKKKGKKPEEPQIELGQKKASAWNATLEFFSFRTSLDWIHPKTLESPSLKKLVDTLIRPNEHMPGSMAPERRSVMTAVALETAKYTKDINEAYRRATTPWVRPLQAVVGGNFGTRGGLSIRQNAELNEIRRGARSAETASSNIRKLARDLQGIEDRFYDYLHEVFGDDVKYVQNHMYRDYAPVRLLESKKHKQQLWREVGRKNGIESKTMDEIWDHLVRHDGTTLKIPEARSRRELKALIRQPAMARKASQVDYERTLAQIPDADLMPFLNNDVYATMTKGLYNNVSRTEFARTLGRWGEGAAKLLNEASKELNAKGLKLHTDEVARIYDVIDGLQRMYMAEKYNPLVKKLNRIAIPATNLSVLNFAALMSVPEIMLPASKVGWWRFAKTMPSNLYYIGKSAARNIYRDLPKGRAEILLDDIAKSGSQAALERMNAVFAGDFTALDNFTFKANLLYYWTKFANYAAVNAYDRMWRGYFEAANRNDSTGWRRLNNISPREARHMEELARYYGLDLAEGRAWARAGFPTEGPFYERYKGGAHTFAEDAVLMPQSANTPMWHSNPNLAMLKHLKSFPTLFFTKIIKQWSRNIYKTGADQGIVNATGQTMHLASVMAGMTTVAMLVNFLRDQITYGGDNPHFDENDVPWQIARGIERMGALGSASQFWDGLVYSRRGLLVSMAGPEINLANDLISGMSEYMLKGQPKELSGFISRRMPYGGMVDASRKEIGQAAESILRDISPWDVRPRSASRTKRAR